jgi:hypothetical protein
MTCIWYDPVMPDDERRERLFAGELFVYSPFSESLELVKFADRLVREAFGNLSPEFAQFEMQVEEYASVLGKLKPRFIHHPECKQRIPAILKRLGCDAENTYFDVPRLRTSTAASYLTTGIAYAFHPHRDTWYSAPMCQINWWMPVYPLASDNGMAFHTEYWDQALANSSAGYDYQEWNRTSRFDAAKHIGVDTREQPRPLEPLRPGRDIRLIPPPGGIVVFSAAQLHSSVPNTSDRTRFSIDFRTVNVNDVRAFAGARNVDSRCSGSTMEDYLRCTDGSQLPRLLREPYDRGPPPPVVAA